MQNITQTDGAIGYAALRVARPGIFSRKVARSGHISYEGRPYFISKALAGHYIRLVVLADRLIVDASIPLHKEYPLV